MKYLKKYFLFESADVVLYSKITEEEVCNRLGIENISADPTKNIDISNNEIKKIEEFLKRYSFSLKPDFIYLEGNKKNFLYFGVSNTSFSIYKLPDNWWIFETDYDGWAPDEYFLCDEIEGLFQVFSLVFKHHKKIDYESEQLKKKLISKIKTLDKSNLIKVNDYITSIDTLKILKESASEKLYDEISITDYEERLGDYNFKTIDFSEYEINKIKDFFKQYKIQYRGEIVSICKDKDINLYGLQQKQVYISKLDDEWYLVSIRPDQSPNKHYKCDGIEGLLECLTTMMKGYKKQDYNKEKLRSEIITLVKSLETEDLVKIKQILGK